MSGDNSGRYEVVVGRRVFTAAHEPVIVAESSDADVNVLAVARRHGIKPSQLFRWRRKFATSSPPQPSAPRFLPVSIAVPAVSPPSSLKPGMMEIEWASGRKLRVAPDIDVAELRRIIIALETA